VGEGKNMIDKNTPIIEALRSHPDAREVFMKHGMGCIGCMGSTNETIENGARMHGIDVDALVHELNGLMFEK
jgi:hybrid cluster-associated redox disulfide protein